MTEGLVRSGTQRALHVGLDGCRAGWLAVVVSADGLTHRVHQTFADLLDACADADSIFVDTPIGLPSRKTPARGCDVEARRLLGPGRASSVFSPPCREAAHAPDLARARALNLLELDRSLSAQAWGICPKIAEVDQLLQSGPHLCQRVKEVHPELCFWAFNGGRPLRFSKKQRAGADERTALLNALMPSAAEFIETVLRAHRRKEVARDDVVDALGAALTAAGESRRLFCLPTAAQHDDTGLPMGMWALRPAVAGERP